jgi:hypothetical protein
VLVAKVLGLPDMSRAVGLGRDAFDAERILSDSLTFFLISSTTEEHDPFVGKVRDQFLRLHLAGKGGDTTTEVCWSGFFFTEY